MFAFHSPCFRRAPSAPFLNSKALTCNPHRLAQFAQHPDSLPRFGNIQKNQNEPTAHPAKPLHRPAIAVFPPGAHDFLTKRSQNPTPIRPYPSTPLRLLAHLAQHLIHRQLPSLKSALATKPSPHTIIFPGVGELSSPPLVQGMQLCCPSGWSQQMKRLLGLLKFALVLVLCSQLPAAMQATSPAKAKTTAKPENIKKAVDRLVREGEGALAAGDFKAARDSFMDALQLDKKNMLAGHGLGLAYIGLHD
ncbi:MAG TPA: hypothetical protein VGP94_05355, partial [Tepidisphaeraceae bacterium]|nr:hypothetical protein [Tepidisphaeraceae bacterium]